MRKKKDLSEKQLACWAELLNLLADLARAVIADDTASIQAAQSDLAKCGWTVTIEIGVKHDSI